MSPTQASLTTYDTSATVTFEGALEVKTYPDSYRVLRLRYCPICGPTHPFEDNEPRWRHFLEDHQPEDLGLTPHEEPNLVTDGGSETTADSRLLLCDVKGCTTPAIVRVYPTHGQTNHTALRCEDCLEHDLNDTWLQDWQQAIYDQTDTPDPDLVTDGGHDPARNPLTKILDTQGNADYARADLDIALERLDHMGEDYDRVRYHVREALQHLHAAQEVTQDD